MSNADPRPTAEEQALIERVRSTSDPDALIAELREEEPDLLVRLAAADVLPQFRAWFSSEAFEVVSMLGLEHGDPIVAAEWVFTGTHDQDLAFQGMHATGTDVEVRGSTVFESDGRRLLVRRYVDWMGLYAQLGLAVNWRLPVETVGDA